jgi:hypothetical protein
MELEGSSARMGWDFRLPGKAGSARPLGEPDGTQLLCFCFFFILVFEFASLTHAMLLGLGPVCTSA